MKTIGLIGGMSWESSAEYYRIINQEVSRRLGPPHSAQILMYSVDFGQLERLQSSGRWDEAGALMADAALRLERGGADFILICANTMHKSIDAMRAAGLRFSGFSDDELVEVIELPGHPWFVAVQFHPEFTSTPRDSHPLFSAFIRAARAHNAGLEVSATGAAPVGVAAAKA